MLLQNLFHVQSPPPPVQTSIYTLYRFRMYDIPNFSYATASRVILTLRVVSGRFMVTGTLILPKNVTFIMTQYISNHLNSQK